MVNKLSKYEVKILNRVISHTTESSQFSVFEIVNGFNSDLSCFDRHYIQTPDKIALTLSNFLIDKELAIKSFEQILLWTDKGKRLRKYRNYYLYKLAGDIAPESSKLIAWVLAIITIVTLLVSYFR